jgi:hypothetical protein
MLLTSAAFIYEDLIAPNPLNSAQEKPLLYRPTESGRWHYNTLARNRN